MNENLTNYSIRLIKHSSIYGLGAILNRAVSLILLPLYTRLLSVGDYGDLELFLITSSFIVLVLQLGIGSAMFRSVIYKTGKNMNVIVSTAFFTLVVAVAFLVGILCLLAEPLSLAIFKIPERAYLLRVLFIADFFNVIAVIAQAKLRIDERSSLYTFVALGNFIIGLLLTSFFVAVLKWGIAGVIWAQLIDAIIFFLIYFATIVKDIRFTFSWFELKDMLEFGLPLVPGSIATSILMLSNRYFLKHLGNVTDVGLFSAGFRIAQVIALIVNAVQMAWPTLLFSIVKEENAPRTYSKLLTYFVFVLVACSLFFSIFAREILKLLTSDAYLDAQYLIPLLALANLFWGVFYMASIGIQVEKKTIYVPFITGLAAVTNLALNYWLIAIPHFSLWGAALASFISHLVMALAAMGISLHYYYVPYEYRKLLQVFGYAVILYLIGIWLPLQNIWLSLTVKGGLMLLFLVLLYFGRFFTVNEIEKMRQLLCTAGNRLIRLRTDGQV